MIRLVRTNSSDKHFRDLIRQLDAELNKRYGLAQTRYDQYNKISHISTVAIAYHNTEPAGCGCFKRFDKNTAEIKRMFVLKDYRGEGVASMILKELEGWAKEKQFSRVILETGIGQPEAIGLYSKCGYLKTENYGPYVGMKSSVCMMKVL